MTLNQYHRHKEELNQRLIRCTNPAEFSHLKYREAELDRELLNAGVGVAESLEPFVIHNDVGTTTLRRPTNAAHGAPEGENKVLLLL